LGYSAPQTWWKLNENHPIPVRSKSRRTKVST
jgi:hypothetical protein